MPIFHEDFDPDPEHAGREHVPANDFREILARHGSGIARIRHGHKQPHAHFITSFAGLKKNAGRETLTEPRMSSKWSLLGPEGRMRILSNLQRRRRGAPCWKSAALGNFLLEFFSVIDLAGSPWGIIFPDNCSAPSRKR